MNKNGEPSNLVEETAAGLEDGQMGVVPVGQQVEVVPLNGQTCNRVGWPLLETFTTTQYVNINKGLLI